MKHNPPTAPLIYIAEPVDLARGQSHDGAVIARELADCGVTCYRPVTTWSGGQHNPALVEKINRDMLSRADAVVVIGTTGVPSIGTWMEVEQARTRDIPVIVRWHATTPKSVSLQAAEVLWADSNSAAVGEALHQATQHHKAAAPAGPEPLRFTVSVGAEPPRMAFQDDAGLDLVTAVDTEVPPGSFVDVPTTITGVQCPRGVWLEIAPRSSTIRKRGLLVPKGVIDHGWRGPLMAGVWNLTSETVLVRAGERVAQAILHHSVTEQHPVQVVVELEPHARGLAGFGSSGS